MKNKYLAKTNKEKTIKEHTQDLLEQYQTLQAIYPNILPEKDWKILDYAIKYHDLGKINTKFQNKLYQKLKYDKTQFLIDNNANEEIPHNFLSPCFINTKQFEEEYSEEDIRILVSAVYYHHDREEKEITNVDIEDLKDQTKNLEDFFDIDLKNIKKYSKKYILKSDNESDINIMENKRYVLIKGLLNKLDYVASMDKENVKVEENVFQDEKTISEKVKDITRKKFNNQYRPVQKYMMNKQEKNLIVISYTGSGKTEAVLLWIGNSKAFYTLPLKVSINAMYERITKNIGYEKALLLHSDAYSYYTQNYDEDLNMYDRARRMSSPLIVTTVDQLFKIAFRYKGYEEILATLSYSKVILDEIQMYSPEMLAYILLGLSIITKMGGKFAIVTATFPPLLYNIMDKLKIPYEKQEESFVPHINNRHKIELVKNSDFNIKSIMQNGKNKRVLVIVNTIKKAQKLYEELKEENVHLLHSNYLKPDRDKLEKEILEFGQESHIGEKGIWISTQIVEASLDIDFDILYTEMCSIDSLFQRMGRVYRKRNYDQNEANVYIYDNRNGVPYIINEKIYEFTIKELENHGNNNLSEDKKQEMINNIFSLDINKELKESDYYSTILREINLLSEIAPNQATKELISKKFRNIQNINVIPDNIYQRLNQNNIIDEWKKVLNSYKSSIKEKMKVKEKIQNCTISIRWNNKLDIDNEELFYKRSNIYRTRYIYEFNEENNKGRGLVKEIDGNFDE